MDKHTKFFIDSFYRHELESYILGLEADLETNFTNAKFEEYSYCVEKLPQAKILESGLSDSEISEISESVKLYTKEVRDAKRVQKVLGLI